MSQDEFIFSEEEEIGILVKHEPWVVLIVDDDTEVHSVTNLALHNFLYEEKKILFLSAYSAKEATTILEQRDDIAIVLLDVVMETDTAGLDLVKTIRGRLQNNNIRIIIRTGQPGKSPARYVIDNYDINDYQEKAELTAVRLYVTIRSSLSQYKQMIELENSKVSLKNQHIFLQKIIDLVPVAIFWKDMDGIYLGANKQFVEDAQLDDISQIIGKTDYDMTWKRDAKQFREDDAAVVKSGVPQLLYEEEQPKEDGSCIYVVTSKVPLRDIHDNIIGVLGVYSDITEHKRLEQEAIKRDAQLVQQSRLAQMGEMISMIAHQWRQPLSAISSTSMNLQLQIELEKYDLNTIDGQAKQNENFSTRLKDIDGFVQNLTTTIDDFRNFYKPSKKQNTVKLDLISIKALAIMKPSLIKHNINVIENYCCNDNLEIFTNEVVQVVLNILKNAEDNFLEKDIKDPCIKIITNDKVLAICDNGGGIPEDIIDKIFDPYFSTKNEKNGTGLGLYMSKMIIEEHHDAKLEVANTSDGVCFTIKFGTILEEQKI